MEQTLENFNYTETTTTTNLANLTSLLNLNKSNYLMSLTLNNIKSTNYNLDTSIVSSNLNNTLNTLNTVRLQANQNQSLECLNYLKALNSTAVSSSLPANCSYLNGTLQSNAELLNEFAMPLFQQLIWSFLFGLIVFISTAGNMIICWIILFHKRMRSVTNMYLYWRFGLIYCKISNFIAILSVSASVWSLFAIAIDRFQIIIYPLKARISKFCTIIITISIWAFSAILSLPNIIFSTTEKQNFKNNSTRIICYLVFPDGESSKSNVEYIYNIIILLTTYFIPILGMVYAYSRIGVVLWSKDVIGECCTDKQMESIKSKRKIVKMMIVVCSLFAVLWIPYHLYFLATHHFPSILDSPNVQHIYLAIYAFAMSHSMTNPLILCVFNSRFRAGFRSVFCCVCLRSRTSRERFKEKYSKENRKKRSQFSGNECQTNQTRIRCTTITCHTVAPAGPIVSATKVTNGKLLNNTQEATLTNINRNLNKFKSDKESTVKQYQTKQTSSKLNTKHPNSNHSNGQLSTNDFNSSSRAVNKRTVNQLDVHLELEENLYNENNNNNCRLDQFGGDKKNDTEQTTMEHNRDEIGKKCLLDFRHKTVIKPDPTKETKLNESSVEIENDK